VKYANEYTYEVKLLDGTYAVARNFTRDGCYALLKAHIYELKSMDISEFDSRKKLQESSWGPPAGAGVWIRDKDCHYTAVWQFREGVPDPSRVGWPDSKKPSCILEYRPGIDDLPFAYVIFGDTKDDCFEMWKSFRGPAAVGLTKQVFFQSLFLRPSRKFPVPSQPAIWAYSDKTFQSCISVWPVRPKTKFKPKSVRVALWVKEGIYWIRGNSDRDCYNIMGNNLKVPMSYSEFLDKKYKWMTESHPDFKGRGIWRRDFKQKNSEYGFGICIPIWEDRNGDTDLEDRACDTYENFHTVDSEVQKITIPDDDVADCWRVSDD